LIWRFLLLPLPPSPKREPLENNPLTFCEKEMEIDEKQDREWQRDISATERSVDERSNGFKAEFYNVFLLKCTFCDIAGLPTLFHSF
jgi:hypothetical protein